MKMDEGARRWVIKTAREQMWRVHAWYEFDDLVQDGMLHWQRINNKYKDVKTPAHVMSLFKRCFLNHIHDLSKQRTRHNELHADDVGGDDAWALLSDRLIAMAPSGAMAFAPDDLRALLARLQTDEGARLARMPHRRRSTGRETLNERLCKILGIAPTRDVATPLRQYLTP